MPCLRCNCIGLNLDGSIDSLTTDGSGLEEGVSNMLQLEKLVLLFCFFRGERRKNGFFTLPTRPSSLRKGMGSTYQFKCVMEYSNNSIFHLLHRRTSSLKQNQHATHGHAPILLFCAYNDKLARRAGRCG